MGWSQECSANFPRSEPESAPTRIGIIVKSYVGTFPFSPRRHSAETWLPWLLGPELLAFLFFDLRRQESLASPPGCLGAFFFDFLHGSIPFFSSDFSIFGHSGFSSVLLFF